MLSEMEFLETWMRMASAIREWLAADEEEPYPTLAVKMSKTARF